MMKKYFLFLFLALVSINTFQSKFVWAPSIQQTFYYQINGVLNKGVIADVYFINYLDNPTAVAELKQSGRRVICNFSIGIYEKKNADSNSIPKFLLGNPVPDMYQASYINYAGYQTTGLKEVMTNRIDQALASGCDGVEFDNYDFYAINSQTGLLLNYNIQLDYFKFLASYARQLGLSVSLKNNRGQVKDLITFVDFAVGEDCDSTLSTCNYLDDFINNNKAAFGISYRENYPNYVANNDWQQLCVQYILKRYSWIIRTQTQDNYHLRCFILQKENSNIIDNTNSNILKTALTFIVLPIIYLFI